MGAILFSRLPQTKDVSGRGQDLSMGRRRMPIRKEPTMMGPMPGKPGDLRPIKVLATMATSMLSVEEMQDQADDRLIFVSVRRIESSSELGESIV
jgi:hypothetical protein